MTLRVVYSKDKRISREEPLVIQNRHINRFVTSVNHMNEVILVPSKLHDISSCDSQIIPSETDLFSYFKMLNSVKNDLINGLPSKDFERQISLDEGFGSLTSWTSSDGSESLPPEGEYPSISGPVAQLSNSFLQHLTSLYVILEQFADAADYISQKYQEELDVACI